MAAIAGVQAGMAASHAINLLRDETAVADKPQDDPLAWLNFRFPHEALRMQHLYSTNDEFRTLCDEYGEALRALRHWETAVLQDDGRVREYRTLVGEIEAEMRALLQRSIPH